MIRRSVLARSLVAAAVVFSGAFSVHVPSAHAQAQAISMPGDPRLVVYAYDMNNTFPVYSAPGMATNIEIGSDETFKGLIMGDTISWVREQIPGTRHLFIKPVREGVTTSATIVTSKRSYQLVLHGVKQSDKWFQRVSWHYPEILLAQQEEETRRANVVATETKVRNDAVVSSIESVSKMNWYDIHGDASFRPIRAFDDGRFTMLQMPDVSEMPALFLLPEKDGEALLGNYVVRGNYLVLQRLAPNGILLKVGDKEVKVLPKNRHQGTGFWSNLFGRNEKEAGQ